MAKKPRPPICEPQENASRMLAKAKSDLSIARNGKKSDDTLYETLCTSCHQAIEKSFKALMIHRLVPYPPTHEIDELIVQMEKHKVILPADLMVLARAYVTVEDAITFPIEFDPVHGIDFGAAIPLSEYAGNRRYSLSETFTEQDYKNVLARAEKIVDWVEQEIRN